MRSHYIFRGDQATNATSGFEPSVGADMTLIMVPVRALA